MQPFDTLQGAAGNSHALAKVRLALVGIGNCASSLVQGLQYYRDLDGAQSRPAGLMHAYIGPYRVADVEVVAAFDVDAKKVGRDLAEAIFIRPNNTLRFVDELPLCGVPVLRGHTYDGLGNYYKNTILEAEQRPVDVLAVLRDTHADVVVNYLPVGSDIASKHYASEALRAGCAFVNCIPVFIASDAEWAKRFKAAEVPLIGDDIKSQVGATILHRLLVSLFEKRGIQLDRTSQLNVGGNMDFMNMLERERLTSKKISKTAAVTSQLSTPLQSENVHIGPSDYVAWLEDRKWAYIRLEGRGFGQAPIALELKLEVWDSPNSAGVVIDAVRCAKLALDRNIGGPLVAPSAYYMKSPPLQVADERAHMMLEEFLGSPDGTPALASATS